MTDRDTQRAEAAGAVAELAASLEPVIPDAIRPIVAKALAIAYLDGSRAGALEAVAILRRELVRAVNG